MPETLSVLFFLFRDPLLSARETRLEVVGVDISTVTSFFFFSFFLARLGFTQSLFLGAVKLKVCVCVYVFMIFDGRK